MTKALVLATALVCRGLPGDPSSSLGPTSLGSEPIEAVLLRETVGKLGSILDREYFDPKSAAKISEALQNRLQEGRYQGIRSPYLLAKALTEDLFAWTGDKHLVVSSIPQPPSGTPFGSTSTETSREVEARRSNFGVQAIEVLPGNIGYLNLTAFYRPSEARDALASAMALLRHTEALIVDLRNNGGGSSQTLALFASYFFDAQGLDLFEVVLRPPAKPAKFQTESAALPDRSQERPMYILTSGSTWSGGEGFAAIMQDRHRAEVVGQRTAGAGNQARTFPLGFGLEVTVSNGQARTAVGKRTWEGTGVTPDVPTPAHEALRTAQALALQRLMVSHPRGAWHEFLREQLSKLEVPHKP